MAKIQLPIDVTRVIDGDTLEGDVVLRLPVKVRLLDCWAEESGTIGGELATEKLRQLAEGKTGELTVPYTIGKVLSRSLSFGRLLGRVEINNLDLSEALVAAGHATKEKQ